MNDLNPYAPPCFNGINDTSPEGYHDEDYTYVFDYTSATSAVSTQYLQTDVDANFAWRAVSAPLAPATGTYASQNGWSVRFSDGQSYFLSEQFMNGLLIETDPFQPFPMSPGEILVPAGAQIRIDIQLVSGQSVEIQFRGVKRYRKPS